MAKYRVKKNDTDGDGHFRAQSISVVSCEHGSVWVRLHDRAGEIGAFACMPKETALEVAKEILSNIEHIQAGNAGTCKTVH